MQLAESMASKQVQKLGKLETYEQLLLYLEVLQVSCPRVGPSALLLTSLLCSWQLCFHGSAACCSCCPLHAHVWVCLTGQWPASMSSRS